MKLEDPMKAMVCLMFSVLTIKGVSEADNSKKWKDSFDTSSCKWSSIGRNDYFILEPGYQQILEGKEGGRRIELVISVTDEIRKIGDVETRVVEERESHDGQLQEVSKNYFAVCEPSHDVYYFGEAVDIYEDGKVVHHEGEWLAGSNGARAGLFISSNPKVGERFYQELAPDVAMDRVEVISTTETLITPAGRFTEALKTEETTPLEPGAREVKLYAKRVGIIQDGGLLLVKFGQNSQ